MEKLTDTLRKYARAARKDAKAATSDMMRERHRSRGEAVERCLGAALDQEILLRNLLTITQNEVYRMREQRGSLRADQLQAALDPLVEGFNDLDTTPNRPLSETTASARRRYAKRW